VAFNAPSLAKFGPTVRAGGTVVYDSSTIEHPPELSPGVRLVGVPITEIAADLGKPMVKNVVALGALLAASDLFPAESLLATLRRTLKAECALLAINEEAFAWGARSVAETGQPC
jgi:Pyruvate/2-oxoacid:ferredoxin oxidoreductase gamma subunit